MASLMRALRPQLHGFKAELAELGYARENQFVSRVATGTNSVFIATKQHAVLGDLAPPAFDPEAHAETNFLHVRLPGADLEIVGLRAPAYAEQRATQMKRQYWDSIHGIMEQARGRRILFIGDMNLDPFNGDQTQFQPIAHPQVTGYHIPKPRGTWSYQKYGAEVGSAIDHAFISDSVKAKYAMYIHAYEGITIEGGPKADVLSDHAVLIVALEAG